MPDDVCFQTKPEIASQQLRQALADGVPTRPAYGNDSKLRVGISGLALTYLAGILPTTMEPRQRRQLQYPTIPSEAPGDNTSVCLFAGTWTPALFKSLHRWRH